MTLTATETLTPQQQEQALSLVEAWVNRFTGEEADVSTGLTLVPEWQSYHIIGDQEFIGEPCPAIILEGGPQDWAMHAMLDEGLRSSLEEIGVCSSSDDVWNLTLHPHRT